MLVLSRKQSEVILIDGGIELHVLEIKGDRVKLGVLAPPEVQVARKEVWIQRQKETSHVA